MSENDRGAGSLPGRTTSTAMPDPPGESSRWNDLVAEIGVATAEPLTAALERIHALITSGRIDRASLHALRDEVERARQAGMIGQQITRFASGRLRQSHERLQLADTLKSVLAHRQREVQARGILLKPVLKPADVTVDASLLFSLLNTVLDWALDQARGSVEFKIDIKHGPQHARLSCRFANRWTHQAEAPIDATAPGALDSLYWRLLQQTAWTMGLSLDRSAHLGGETLLVVEFPRTVNAEVEALLAPDTDEGFAPSSSNSKPLAGSHVLVISSRRDLRVQVRDALRNMGLIVDFVNSVDEAAEFCSDGLPDALVIESIQSGDRFTRLREELLAEVPEFVFVEIVEEGNTFEMSGFGGSTVARVGRDAVASSLPSALMFELSKGL